jgi:hypothetical protein
MDFEHMKRWTYEHMKIWKDEHMKRWKDENMQIYKYDAWEEKKRTGKRTKNETPLHLLGIEPASPATPDTPAIPPYSRPPTATHCHTSHLSSPNSHLTSPTSNIKHLPSPTANIQHQTSHHIYTSSLTHNHPTQ